IWIKIFSYFFFFALLQDLFFPFYASPLDISPASHFTLLQDLSSLFFPYIFSLFVHFPPPYFSWRLKMNLIISEQVACRCTWFYSFSSEVCSTQGFFL
ncbi:unnamed protein product, partial [Coffea canephora]